MCFVAGVYGQLTLSPENVAGLVENSVTLKCAGPSDPSGESLLQWEDASDRDNAIILSTLGTVLLPERYELITTPAGRYDLVIKDLGLRDGRKYRCKSLQDSSSYTFVEVIIFNGKTPSLLLLGCLHFKKHSCVCKL